MLFISLFIGLVINGKNSRKVFVLQSYYTDYPWTNSVGAGLDSILKKQDLVKVKTYYMDTKRNPSEDFKKKTAALATKIIDSYKPDVLIAVDDDAQQYVAKNFVNSKNMAIVFLGVNDNAATYGYDKANNVTGILERVPVKALIDVANVVLKDKIDKKTRKIKAMHVGDQSNIVVLDDKYMHNYPNLENIELLPSHLVKTQNQWKKAVLDANSKIDVLIITNSGKQLLEKEGSTKFVDSKELISWTIQHCKHPIIGLNDFLVGDGLPFALSVSPLEFGVAGGRMALEIINKKIPISNVSKQFPITKSDHFVVTMRPKEVQNSDLKRLPEIYPSSAYATNRVFD